MKPSVSIIMGSTSDMPVMEKACKFLNDMQIPFEVNALSAHRTPQAVEQFAKDAKGRGIKVIIAGAGMAAALPGVIAAMTTLPVIGVPIKGMLDGLDAMLSIIQMPPGIPVATVGVNGAMNAAILAVEMIALADEDVAARLAEYKAGLGAKIEKANKELAESTHTSRNTTVKEPAESESQVVDTSKKVMRGGRKVMGYRVQAYSGGNSRADRQRAESIGNAIKMRFPDLPIYVHFYSPRWICRVGNFRTYQEANEVLQEIKGMGYRQACIVKGKITVRY